MCGTFPVPTEGWIAHMVAEAQRFDRHLADRVRVGLPLAIRCRETWAGLRAARQAQRDAAARDEDC